MRNYFIGISWFILSLLSSVMNDVIAKYSGLRLHSFEISFLRFLFSTLTLIPFIVYYGTSALHSERPMVHVIRGALLFVAITAWIDGLSSVPITTATVITFTMPLFVLVLAMFFLKENVIWQRWFATIIGFAGILVIMQPNSDSFNSGVLLLIAAAILFASLDIVNKLYVVKESMISMLFYSAIVTTILAAGPAFYYWQTPTAYELFLFFILGGSANLILFFLLKAFAIIDATAVAPYRYLELFFSAILGYFIFNDTISFDTLIGAAIIIPSTLFIVYSERNKMDSSGE